MHRAGGLDRFRFGVSSPQAMTHAMRIALVVLCATVYLVFSPGRILFPDDEIVFQTTRSLYERGSLAVEGIPKRTGELEGRPDGTFGWAPGTDGKRYGFFGHALSIAALPLYGAGKVARDRAPETWRHAIRSDTYFMHRRSPDADWPRMLVSFTNCFVTALAAWVLAEWIVALGYGARIGVATALAYAFGTSAWTYTGTLLSEPLSALMLLLSALGVTRFLADRDARPKRARAWLRVSGALVGLSVHAHVLNVVAVPAFVLWLVGALRRDGDWPRQRTAVIEALALGAAGLALLGLSQYLRFGNPLETGRYDHYSHFVVPAEGLLAMVASPGRSIFVYSPALFVALPGVRGLLARHRDVAVFIGVLVLCRWAFVAARSDWWGGWAIGPRYLLPLVPFMIVPLAEVLWWLRARAWPAKAAVGLGLLASIAVSLHLATHNIAEHMVKVSNLKSSMAYLDISHWVPSASPIVGFFGLPTDTLAHGASKLADHGHPGLFHCFVAIGAVGLLAASVLGWTLAKVADRGQ